MYSRVESSVLFERADRVAHREAANGAGEAQVQRLLVRLALVAHDTRDAHIGDAELHAQHSTAHQTECSRVAAAGRTFLSIHRISTDRYCLSDLSQRQKIECESERFAASDHSRTRRHARLERVLVAADGLHAETQDASQPASLGL